VDNFIGPVNLGNPDEFTILQLARHILENTGSRSKIVYHPLPSDDPTQRKPDITLARNKLGWHPEVALTTGLKQTINYFEELLHRGQA
jgi:UDP-glucuronate decarboxylase